MLFFPPQGREFHSDSREQRQDYCAWNPICLVWLLKEGSRQIRNTKPGANGFSPRYFLSDHCLVIPPSLLESRKNAPWKTPGTNAFSPSRAREQTDGENRKWNLLQLFVGFFGLRTIHPSNSSGKEQHCPASILTTITVSRKLQRR